MAENRSKEPKLIAMNSMRPSGPSGISVDTNIAVSGKGMSEDQFYAVHSDEKDKGIFAKLRALFKGKERS